MSEHPNFTINSFAFDLSRQFESGMDRMIINVLKTKFGGEWFSKGIKPHLNQDSLKAKRETLESPVRTLDGFDSSDEYLFGMENYPSIVSRNWGLFRDHLTSGTKVSNSQYANEKKKIFADLQTIKDFRNGISHSKEHNQIRSADLIIFAELCRRYLKLMNSSKANDFDRIVRRLEQGEKLWAVNLSHNLPGATTIVKNFVGREAKIDELYGWLESNDNAHAIRGDGGVGKSSLAFHFAKTILHTGISGIEFVLWLSAKTREFIEGEEVDREPDFWDFESFGNVIYRQLYDDVPESFTPEDLAEELSNTPCLIILDDFDTISVQKNDTSQQLEKFVMRDLVHSKSRFLFTTRQNLTAVKDTEITGFDLEELKEFIGKCAFEYGENASEKFVELCVKNINRIRSTTEGKPLYIHEFLRSSAHWGVERTLKEFQGKTGDGVRAYALQRQLKNIDDDRDLGSKLCLIAVSVAKNPVSLTELKTVTGYSEDQVEGAIQGLLRWHLINEFSMNELGVLTYTCSANTRRIVQLSFEDLTEYKSYNDHFKKSRSLTPTTLRKNVRRAINQVSSLTHGGHFEDALKYLDELMKGRLAKDADLWGIRGWVYGKQKCDNSVSMARDCFIRATTEFKTTNEEVFYQWLDFEQEIVENLEQQIGNSDRDPTMAQLERQLELWRNVQKISEQGIRQCGDSPILCQQYGYFKHKEAVVLSDLKRDLAAKTAFQSAADFYFRALHASSPSHRDVNRSILHRGHVSALIEVGEPETVIKALSKWRAAVPVHDRYLRDVYQSILKMEEYEEYFSGLPKNLYRDEGGGGLLPIRG